MLLLVHGFPLDHSMWEAQIEAFAKRYRVVAVDLRGFGQSSGIVGRGSVGRMVEMEQFADDLAALLDSLEIKEPIFLAGHSMGGYVAFQFALKWPRRLRGLILCDTKAMNDTPEMATARRGTAKRILYNGPAELVEAMMPRLFAASPVAKSTLDQRPQLVDSLRGVMMGTDRRAIAAAALGMARRPDVRPLLHRIKCPTLVVVGSHDVISPVDEMREIADGIPGSQFVEIAGGGHMSSLEKPEEFNAAVLKFMSITES